MKPEAFIRAHGKAIKKAMTKGSLALKLIEAFEADIEIKCARKEELKEENRGLTRRNEGLTTRNELLQEALTLATRRAVVLDETLTFNVDRLDKIEALMKEVFPDDLDPS